MPFIGAKKIGSLPFCVGNLMAKIHGNGTAPFRFLTPFPHRPPRHLRNSAFKIYHFQPDVRIQSFFHQIDSHVLKHTRRPISSASLGRRFGKAKSSRSLLPFPCILPTLSWKRFKRLNSPYFWRGIWGRRIQVPFHITKSLLKSDVFLSS